MRAEEASSVFAAMGQPNRLAILQCLAPHSHDDGPGLPAGQIAECLGLAPATLSFHLKEMSRVGLVRPRRAGRRIFYRVDIPRMLEALEFAVGEICEAPAQPA